MILCWSEMVVLWSISQGLWSKKLSLRSEKLIGSNWWSSFQNTKGCDQKSWSDQGLLSWRCGEAMHRQQQVVSWFRLSPRKPLKTCPTNILSPKIAQNLSQKYSLPENCSKLVPKIFSPRKQLKIRPKNILSPKTAQNLSQKYSLPENPLKLVPKIFPPRKPPNMCPKNIRWAPKNLWNIAPIVLFRMTIGRPSHCKCQCNWIRHCHWICHCQSKEWFCGHCQSLKHSIPLISIFESVGHSGPRWALTVIEWPNSAVPTSRHSFYQIRFLPNSLRLQ